MMLSIVSDELKIPQGEAFPLIREWGVERVELRGLTGGRIPEGDVDEAAALVASHGVAVTALSPGVFKCAPGSDEIASDLERLERTLPLCERFGVDLVIVFAVQNPDWNADDPADGETMGPAVDALCAAGRLAAEAGVRLAIENEPAYTAVSSRGLAHLIDRVGLENVGANWDPGNAYPFDPEIDSAVGILGDRIFNVHVKDTWAREGQRGFDAVGGGQIDWRGHIDALGNAGYGGAIVVETHCIPGVEKSKRSVDVLAGWLG